MVHPEHIGDPCGGDLSLSIEQLRGMASKFGLPVKRQWSKATLRRRIAEAVQVQAAARNCVQYPGGEVKTYLDHQPKRVVVLGMGPSIVDLLEDGLTQELTTAYADEVWVINMSANILWHDVCFWMDDLKIQKEFKPGLFDLIKRRNKPIITSKAYPDICDSYDYPVSEIANIGIPVFGKPYLHNSVSQVIGYGLWKGVKEMRIYGADFTYPNREFAEAGRANVEAWITLAVTRGMSVELTKRTSLFDAVNDSRGIYGYNEQPAVYLPNGEIFKYHRASDVAEMEAKDNATDTGYVPQDTSGLGDGGRGAAGERAAADDVGDAAPTPTGRPTNGAADPHASHAAAAVGRSDQGIRPAEHPD